MNFKTMLTGLVAVFALVSAPAQAGYYSSIYAFGDSLSDNGDSMSIADPTLRPPVASDGPVAVWYLSQALGIKLFDYAVGGALSGLQNADYLPANPGDPPHPLVNTGVRSQVLNFVAALGGGPTDSSALFVVSGGGNDVLLDASNPAQLGQDIADNLSTAVAALYASGARNFLLPLLPDIGLTPLAAALDLLNPGSAADLSALSELLNMGLADAYAQLLATLPDASFTIFDTAGAQRAVILDPAGHGLSNVSAPCKDDPTTDCQTSFFWDDLHPTTAASALLALDLQAALPEPASLLLVGVGLLVAASRRRHARV